MEPVYCSGILLTTSDDTQSIKFNNFLKRILNNEILKQSAYLPGVFMPLRPCVINYNPSSAENKLPERDDTDNIECLEWCAQYSAKPHKVSSIYSINQSKNFVDNDFNFIVSFFERTFIRQCFPELHLK